MAEREGFEFSRQEFHITTGKNCLNKPFSSCLSQYLGVDFPSAIGKTNPVKMVSDGMQKGNEFCSFCP